MPTKADAARRQKLHELLRRARFEGWTNDQLGDALDDFYGKRRSTAKKTPAKASAT